MFSIFDSRLTISVEKLSSPAPFSHFTLIQKAFLPRGNGNGNNKFPTFGVGWRLEEEGGGERLMGAAKILQPGAENYTGR